MSKLARVPVLNKLQSNKVFEAIQASQFDPSDFHRVEGQVDDETVVWIQHLPSQSTLIISRATVAGIDMGHQLKWQVGDHPTVMTLSPSAVKGTLTVGIDKWLAELEADIDTPDLWAEFERDRALVQAVSEDPENAPFDDIDKDAINHALHEIEETAQATYSLDGAQFAQLAAGIADLREKLDQMGRREWITYAAGTLALLQATVLPPDASRHILVKLVKAAVNAFGQRHGLSAGP